MGKRDAERDGQGEPQPDKWSNWGDKGDSTGKRRKDDESDED